MDEEFEEELLMLALGTLENYLLWVKNFNTRNATIEEIKLVKKVMGKFNTSSESKTPAHILCMLRLNYRLEENER
jgi:hypothetical protein